MTRDHDPKRNDFRFLHRLRVRWVEVDMQQIVFNGHYLMYVDTAIAAYWRALALPYQDTMLAQGGDLYVRKATLDYEGSARYDDTCEVGLRCAHIGNSSMRFEAAVFRGEQRLVHGELIYVFADPSTQTAQRLPDALRAVVLGFEAGQAMLDVQHGAWPLLRTDVQALRDAVAATESVTGLVDDESARYACARNRLGRVVACARWQGVVDGLCRLDELRVLPAVRGGGVGRALLQIVLGHLRIERANEVLLDAPRSAAGFFACVGFSPVVDTSAATPAGGTAVPMRLRLD